MQWYYSNQGQQKGPVEESALEELVLAGVVRDDTLVWREGMQNWLPHASVRGPRAAPAVPPPGVNEVGYCSECGRPFSANELVRIGAASVCATCKPVYLQRMREGGGSAVGAWHYGGFWIRVVARMIDAILINIVLLAITIPLGAAIGARSAAGNSQEATADVAASLLIALFSVVAAACYEIFFIAKRGATIGKMLVGLKVIRPDGSGIPTGLSTGRYFAQFISSITLGIGYLMAGFDGQKRALHDRICETRVVYSR